MKPHGHRLTKAMSGVQPKQRHGSRTFLQLLQWSLRTRQTSLWFMSRRSSLLRSLTGKSNPAYLLYKDNSNVKMIGEKLLQRIVAMKSKWPAFSEQGSRLLVSSILQSFDAGPCQVVARSKSLSCVIEAGRNSCWI